MSDNVWLTDLADVLRAAGLRVVEVPGWQTRGFNGGTRWGGPGMATNPTGGLAHHTAGPHQSQTSSNYPSLDVVRDGRPGLSGPLAQTGIGYDGTWYVIAAGHANHAGVVDDWRYDNSHAIGVEAENPGDGSAWPPEQYDSYVRGCAALGLHYGIVWRGHKEAAVPHGRKIDPTFSMGKFRRDVERAQRGGHIKPPKGGVHPTVGPRGYPTYGLTVAEVRAVQRACNDHNGAGIDVDGSYGPATIAAVKAFQQVLGVAVDGIWGENTQGAYDDWKREHHDKPDREPTRASRDRARRKPKRRRRFPLAKGHAYARNDWTRWTHSGYFRRDRKAIRRIQRKVGVKADGIFGRRTEAAVERFQRRHHLTVDGQVGPATWSALFN